MMLRSLGLVAFVVAVGCRGGAPLDRVPIDGGTPEQRAAVQEALADFERWAGAGRVRLRAVEFEDELPYMGAYGSRRRMVVVHGSLTASEVHIVIVHELCHAVHHQEWRAVQLGGMDALVAALDDEVVARLQNAGRVGPHGEVFAMLCEVGPTRARFASRSCPGDDPVFAAAAAFVHERVWRGDTDLIGWAPAGEVVTWEAPVPFQHFTAIGAQNSFWVVLSDNTPMSRHRLSVGDASPLTWRESDYIRATDRYWETWAWAWEDAELPEGVPVDPQSASPSRYADRRRVEGFEAYLTPPLIGSSSIFGPMASLGSRVVVQDERGWWASDACPEPDYAQRGVSSDEMQGMIGEVDGVLYAVWKHGQSLSWQRLTPPVE